jgi:hypothetical protein
MKRIESGEPVEAKFLEGDLPVFYGLVVSEEKYGNYHLRKAVSVCTIDAGRINTWPDRPTHFQS